MADLKGEGPDAAQTAIEPQDPEHVGTQLDPGLTPSEITVEHDGVVLQ